MNKRRAFPVVLGILLLVAGWFHFSKKAAGIPIATIQPPPSEILPLPFIPTTVGIRDDPFARTRYEYLQLANPKTGAIPHNIRRKEIVFSRRIRSVTEQLAATGSRSKANEYVARGPFNVGGRTRALAIDRSNEKVIMAGGVSGGMWRSVDEGITWTRTTETDIINSISCLVQDIRPGKMNTWYFGTGEYSVFNSARANNTTPYRGDGIYKSTDSGLSWLPLPATVTNNTSRFESPFQYVYRLVADPTNLEEDVVFAATIGGIYRSADGGESWQPVLGVDLLNEPEGADLNEKSFPYFTEVALTIAGVKYAAIGSTTNSDNSSPLAGLYRSDDGISWSKITPTGFPESFRRVVIASSPSNEREVYFLADAIVPHLWKATWLPSSGNFIWENLSANIPDFGGKVGEFNTQGGYNMLLDIHPADPNIVFMGGTNLYRSTDGFKSGDNTTWIGGYDAENNARQYPNHHADQHALAFYTGSPDVMLSAHDGGVSRTFNNQSEKVSWVSLNNGYITSQFFTVDIPKFEPSTLIVGGMQDNGTYLRSAPGVNPPWDQVFSGDGTFCQTTPGGTFWYVSAQMAQVYRLTFNAKYELTGYARVDPAGGGETSDNGYLFVNPFRLDPLNSNVMYLAGGNVLWRNSNLSQIGNGSQQKTSVNWEKLEVSKISEGQITSMDLSIGPEPSLYYGNSTGLLYRLNGLHNGRYSQTEITSDIFPEGFISSISVNPADPEKVLVVFSNYEIPSIFYSENGGVSFKDISENMEENPDGSGNGPSIRWGQLIPLNDGKTRVVVGTSAGLFTALSVEDEVSWAREDQANIGNSVVPMLSYNPSDGRLVVATHGNGVFETHIENFEMVTKPPVETDFLAGPAYPNPFAAEVKIPLSLPSKQIVRAIVYDASGKAVKTLVWGTQFGGNITISWDGTNVTGTPVANGVYYCRIDLESGGVKTLKLIVYR